VRLWRKYYAANLFNESAYEKVFVFDRLSELPINDEQSDSIG
jgi:hypothetical protein